MELYDATNPFNFVVISAAILLATQPGTIHPLQG